MAMLEPDGHSAGGPIIKPARGVPHKRSPVGARLANAVLAHLPLAVAVIDGNARLLLWNEQAACLFNVPPVMAAGAPALVDILQGVAGLTPEQRDRILDFSLSHIAAGDRTEPESCLRLSLGRGSRIVIQVRGIGSRQWMLLIDDGKSAFATPGSAANQGGDAWLDPLTGLSNRRHFYQVLKGLFDTATPISRHTVLLLDLDRFRPINDTFGPAIGDALLCLVAQRLRRETRDEDLLVRLGGDQFVILIANSDKAEQLAGRVIEILSSPFLVAGHVADISASVGLAWFPTHGATTDELMRHAELAMKEAKSAGGRSWRWFDADRVCHAAPDARQPGAGR